MARGRRSAARRSKRMGCPRSALHAREIFASKVEGCGWGHERYPTQVAHLHRSSRRCSWMRRTGCVEKFMSMNYSRAKTRYLRFFTLPSDQRDHRLRRPPATAIDHDWLELPRLRVLPRRHAHRLPGRTASFLCREDPNPFTYRELIVDPGIIDARLKAIDVSSVEDATLGDLLRAKKKRLKTKLDMLRARNTPGFLPLSIEQYGAAGRVLPSGPGDPRSRPVPVGGGGDRVDAVQSAGAGQDRARHSQLIQPDIDVHVAGQTRCHRGHCVRTRTRGLRHPVPASRVRRAPPARGRTDLVTYVNGSHQPNTVDGHGLAGYEENRGGLAVFGEFLVGGLLPHRLRQLAVRVVAVDRMVAGDSFARVHRTPGRHRLRAKECVHHNGAGSARADSPRTYLSARLERARALGRRRRTRPPVAGRAVARGPAARPRTLTSAGLSKGRDCCCGSSQTLPSQRSSNARSVR